MMKRMLGVLMAMILLMSMSAAVAEEVFSIADVADASAQRADATYVTSSLTTDKSYVRFTCMLNGDTQVNIAISGPDGSLVYQRDYGVCSGEFRSEDVYLRLDGSETVYQAAVTVGDTVYTFPVRRVMARLRDNAACAVGYPLSTITGSDTWKSATILDVSAMEGSSITVPLHASGAYTIGTATLSVSGGQLTVSASLTDGLDGSIDAAKVQAATTAIAAQGLGTKHFTGLVGDLDTPIDLNGAAFAAVYLRLTVSFDPSNLPASPSITLDGQPDLWQRMSTETANEAVG